MMKDLVAAVRAHGIENYYNDGWDIVTESYDDAQIAKAIGTARTAATAIKNVARVLNDVDDYRKEIQSTYF